MANNTTNYSRAKDRIKKEAEWEELRQFEYQKASKVLRLADRFDYYEELQNLRTAAITAEEFRGKLVEFAYDIGLYLRHSASEFDVFDLLGDDAYDSRLDDNIDY